MRYKDAGVNVRLAEEITEEIKRLAESTRNEKVLVGVGGFGAAYAVGSDDILVSSTDSVGTKVLIAAMANQHTSIGEDIVNHCVNDILCQGAKPLFFMDYIAMSVLVKEVVIQLVQGMAKACRALGIPLAGGETAEMPDVYQPGGYDLAGFVVGKVRKKRLIDGSIIRDGDVLLGLPSSGLHTNGYSLARRAVFEISGLRVDERVEELGATVGEELLKAHRCYYRSVGPLVENQCLHGIAHVTGGGFQANVGRLLPKGLRAIIDTSTWQPPPLFSWLQRVGKIDPDEMYSTFNMGIGMVLVLSASDLEKVQGELTGMREDSYLIGKVVKGKRGVELVK
jgi:phosphoribosylformylglycinamidine cyclo-ligase